MYHYRGRGRGCRCRGGGGRRCSSVRAKHIKWRFPSRVPSNKRSHSLTITLVIVVIVFIIIVVVILGRVFGNAGSGLARYIYQIRDSDTNWKQNNITEVSSCPLPECISPTVSLSERRGAS